MQVGLPHFRQFDPSSSFRISKGPLRRVIRQRLSVVHIPATTPDPATPGRNFQLFQCRRDQPTEGLGLGVFIGTQEFGVAVQPEGNPSKIFLWKIDAVVGRL